MDSFFKKHHQVLKWHTKVFRRCGSIVIALIHLGAGQQ